MKKTKMVIPIIAMLLLLFIATAAIASSGGDFEVTFYTMDNGGGTSSGGVYAVSGTIAQHDAGTEQTGWIFTVIGGFWGGGFMDYYTYLPFIYK